jgi:AraC-like DNA-binding protein
MENPNLNHSLNILSENTGYSPAWLSHKFRNISGVSLNEFSTKVKLCNALWNLISTDNPIKSIAIDLGYQPLYFSYKFHKLFELSPSDIRKKYFEYQLKKSNIGKN